MAWLSYSATFLIFCIFYTCCTARRKSCDEGFYFSRRNGTCLQCTKSCPPNQIVRKACSNTRDTVCGPFFELKNFPPLTSKEKQAKKKDETIPNVDGIFSADVQEETEESDIYGRSYHYQLFNSKSKSETNKEDRNVLESDISATQANNFTSSPSVKSETKVKWLVLCYSIMGALIGITLISFICVLTSVLRNRKQFACKTITISDASNPGIHYRTVAAMGDEENDGVIYLNTINGMIPQRELKLPLIKRIYCRLFHKNLSSNNHCNLDAFYRAHPNHGGLIRLRLVPEPIIVDQNARLAGSVDSGLCGSSSDTSSVQIPPT